MNMLYRYYLAFCLCFFIGAPPQLYGQDTCDPRACEIQNRGNCYETLKQEGTCLQEKKCYQEAVNKFLAALNCTNLPQGNGLAELIRQTQNTWTLDLATQRDKAAKELADRIAAEKREKNALKDKMLLDAKGYRSENNYEAALKRYEDILKIDLERDTIAMINMEKRETLKEQIKFNFEKNYQIALALQEANHCITANKYFQKALAGVPDERREELSIAMKKCN